MTPPLTDARVQTVGQVYSPPRLYSSQTMFSQPAEQL